MLEELKLGARDLVIGMELIPRRGEILLLTSDGKAKRLPPDQFPRQGRYGQGVIAWKLPRTSQLVGIAAGKPNTRVTLLLDKLSPKAIRLDEAPLQTRVASGKSVIDLKAGYQVLGVSVPWAVPRAVVGEKPTLEKEIEVPEEVEEPALTAVEQLSFGIVESPVKPSPKTVRSKRAKGSETEKPKTVPVVRKTKAVPGGQAAITAKSSPPLKKVPPSKTTPVKTTKMKTASDGKPQPKHGQPKSKAAPQVSKEKAPANKKSPVKPGSKSQKEQTKKPSAKATKPASGGKSSPAKALKSPLSGHPPTGKSTKTKEKQPAKSTTKPVTGAKAKAPPKRKPRQTKMTIKSADALTQIILPPHWKPPAKRSTSTRHNTKPRKAKP